MKTDSDKKGKTCAAGPMKPKRHCGTLTYLAECRGVTRKPGASPRETMPQDFSGRIVRRYAD